MKNKKRKKGKKRKREKKTRKKRKKGLLRLSLKRSCLPKTPFHVQMTPTMQSQKERERERERESTCFGGQNATDD